MPDEKEKRMAGSLHIEITAANDVMSRRLIVIAWLFTAVIAFALAFTYYGIGLLSAARAYVGGESLWSKAQKDMVNSLERYARYHEPTDYEAYLRSLSVSLGDRQARLELEKKEPDLRIAYDGFFQGRNHPDDIDGMIRLFRNFRHLPEIDKAISIWTRADANIDQVMALAERIRQAIESGSLNDKQAVPFLRELFVINQRLMPMEDEFSYTLGDAARKTKTILLFLLFAGVSMLLLAAFLLSKRLVRQSEDIENALREGEKQLRGLLQFAPLPMIIVRLTDEAILFANEHAREQFKVTSTALDGMRARNLYVLQEDRLRLMEALHLHRSVDDWEARMQDSQGTPFWALMSLQCISYRGQECVLTALTNIEARKRSQQELHRRAFYDELTRLPNRAMFMDHLNRLIATTDPTNDVFALLFIDLDRFKIINDELGHGVGDKLLQQVALRLRSSVQEPDMVARLGGDEFVVLAAVDADAESVTSTARRILKAMEPVFMLDKHTVSVTISIGISCYPQDGLELSTMLQCADVAMYRAKDKGRSNFQWYGVELSVRGAPKHGLM